MHYMRYMYMSVHVQTFAYTVNFVFWRIRRA